MKAEWALSKGCGRWIIAMKSPIAPQELLAIANTYHVERVQPLESGNVAFCLRATPKNVAKLMELPKPTGRGSLHECNWISWHS
ncbi:MAG: hypothetical protein WBA57_14210 [Elainellaceae cyanobacterium]